MNASLYRDVQDDILTTVITKVVRPHTRRWNPTSHQHIWSKHAKLSFEYRPYVVREICNESPQNRVSKMPYVIGIFCCTIWIKPREFRPIVVCLNINLKGTSKWTLARKISCGSLKKNLIWYPRFEYFKTHDTKFFASKCNKLKGIFHIFTLTLKLNRVGISAQMLSYY